MIPAFFGSAIVRFNSLFLLLVPLAVYGGLVSFTDMIFRDQLNPDGVSYIGIARLVAEGRWMDSVSGYWSPLLSWSIAPLLRLGVDSLYAARICLALWGVVLLFGWHFLLQSRSLFNQFTHCAALCLIAMSAVRWATVLVAPDIVLAACLTFYWTAVLSVRLFERKRCALVTGVFGGIAFLAKSYALPFFLIHFSVTVILRWRLSESPLSGSRATRTWLLGLFGFLLVAGPWIGILSWKYEEFTYSHAASVAHAVVGPNDMPRNHPFNRLYSPAEGRMHIWETPELMEYNEWSPFESHEYFMHQVRHTLLSSLRLLANLGTFDLFFFSIPSLLLAPLLVNPRQDSEHAVWTHWVPITIVIYTAGFTLVYNEARYLKSVLWPLTCVYVLWLSTTSFQLEKPRRWALIGLVLCSFSPIADFRLWLVSEKSPQDRARHKVIAQQLTAHHRSGPIATSHNWWDAMFISFHSELPCCGVPEETEVFEIDAALARHAVQTFLVLPEWEFVDEFLANTSWQKQGQFEIERRTYYIFGPP